MKGNKCTSTKQLQFSSFYYCFLIHHLAMTIAVMMTTTMMLRLMMLMLMMVMMTYKNLLLVPDFHAPHILHVTYILYSHWLNDSSAIKVHNQKLLK